MLAPTGHMYQRFFFRIGILKGGISLTNKMLHKKTDSRWLSFTPISRTLRQGYFSISGTTAPTTPNHGIPAYVTKFRNHWALLGLCHRPTAAHPIIGSLREYILSTPYASRWCITNALEYSDEGRHFSDSIQKKSAIAISDGSFKEGKGSAAWVLEGNTSLHRITGCAYAPGGPKEQSAYRSELVGLLALVTMIQAITTFHGISDGQVTVEGDNESALNLAFATDIPITSFSWPTMTS
jgi:hypothetical protein